MDEFIERLAIKCARGNNGGEWSTHYTEKQKDFWRNFARELKDDVWDMARENYEIVD